MRRINLKAIDKANLNLDKSLNENVFTLSISGYDIKL